MNLQRLIDDPNADLQEVSLLRAGKSEAMSDEARRRVLAGVGVGGAALGALYLAEVGGAVSKAAWPAWLKTGLVLSALGGVAGTLAFFGLGSNEPAVAPAALPSNVPAEAVSEPRAPVAPTVAAPSTGPVYQATDLPQALDPQVNSYSQKSNARSPDTAAPEPSLAAELEAIRPAKTRLAAGDAAGALQQVKQYRSAFPQGRLGVEATVLEVEALVALGQRAQAERVAAPLLAGNSPYAARVRSLLGRSSP